MNGYTVFGFLLTLGVLIIVHEWGHYKVARLAGVKVLRFSVGFGRAIWRRQSGDTEFVVGIIPLGGYVRMLDEREDAVLPHERGQTFNSKTLWQRSAIVAAGPIANLVLAVSLYALAGWIGKEEPKAVLSAPTPGTLGERAGLRAGDVALAWSRDQPDAQWSDLRSMTDLRWQILQAGLDGERLRLRVGDGQSRGGRNVVLDLDRVDRRAIDSRFIDQVVGIGPPFGEAVIGQVMVGGPAERAGLQRGDRVRLVDSEPISDAFDLRQRIARLGADGQPAPVVWTVERAGQPTEVRVQPRLMVDGERRLGRIDAEVGTAPAMTTVRYGVFAGLERGLTMTWEQSVLTVKMFGRILIGQASLKNLTGPVTIADYAGKALERGLPYWIGFLAAVSIGLGVLNLMPVPLLDGGHLMYYLFEGLTGRPVPEAWLVWLQRGGALVLAMMMTLAFYNDLAPRLGLH
jgi:regulator of sigma E protease